MSSSYIQETPRLARLEYGNSLSGSSSTSDYELWSPGYRQTSKTDSVRRKKPKDLLGNLTPNGAHVRYALTKTPINFMYRYGMYGDYVRYIDWDPAYWAGVGSAGEAPDPDWVTKLRLKIKDQKVNLAQAVLEFRQTQKMFYTNADTIVRVLSSLGSKRRFKQVKRLLGLPRNKLRQTVSNRWLEAQYGILPLVSDIYGSVEELERRLQLPVVRKVTLKVHDTNEGVLSWSPIAFMNVTPKMVWSWTTSKRVVCYIEHDSLALSRLGYTNPIYLAWELLPYSFLVDYLIGIGNWLNSLDAAIGLNKITGTVSTKIDYSAQMAFGGQSYATGYYARSVFYSLPLPPLPSWKPSLGFTRIANVLALLSQLKR